MAKKMRVIIVEDRENARQLLTHLLSLHPDVDVVGAFADTASAWPVVEAGSIDGIFLDINIVGESERAGLDLAIRIDRLALPKPPWVIFITGFEKYALAAHEVRPFGYLVKPIEDAKLAHVLERVRKAEKELAQVKPKQLGRIEVKHRMVNRGETIWPTKLVTADEILYIQTNNGENTVKVALVQGEVLDGVHLALNRWTEDYDLPGLTKIHKSHVVNLNHVNGLKPDPFKEEGINVTFRGCTAELPVGKTYLAQLKKALGMA